MKIKDPPGQGLGHDATAVDAAPGRADDRGGATDEIDPIAPAAGAPLRRNDADSTDEALGKTIQQCADVAALEALPKGLAQA
ncbi:hypothetical protein QTQ03_18625 [Micromonospora sp. WMMA1363]|uniref:hypothetical protein n=1 Tax=Micromonospora sp. WMMA1363 TaxID=3053985 RepID=UPI00259CAD76|nr:hypothetical protein [Micromonospora sp. WMMA1363]MDM4721509.1 hypothetical protein [Micromonospora sp. WMMA1363]